MRAVGAILSRRGCLVRIWSAYAHNGRPIWQRCAPATYTNYAWSSPAAVLENTQVSNCGRQGVDAQTVPLAVPEAALECRTIRVPLDPNAAGQIILKLPDVLCTSWVLQMFQCQLACDKRLSISNKHRQSHTYLQNAEAVAFAVNPFPYVHRFLFFYVEL